MFSENSSLRDSIPKISQIFPFFLCTSFRAAADSLFEIILFLSFLGTKPLKKATIEFFFLIILVNFFSHPKKFKKKKRSKRVTTRENRQFINHSAGPWPLNAAIKIFRPVILLPKLKFA